MPKPRANTKPTLICGPHKPPSPCGPLLALLADSVVAEPLGSTSRLVGELPGGRGALEIHFWQGYAFAKTLASLASGLALALASKFPIIPKGLLWEWVSANGV